MRRMMSGRSIFAAAAAVSAGALGLATPAVASGTAMSTPRWRIVQQTPLSRLAVLDALVAPTATSAWALGFGEKGIGPTPPIGRHWNGHRWSTVQFPTVIKNSGVACASASSGSDVWAFTGAGGHLGNPPGSADAMRLSRGRWVIEHVKW